jgi:hypothetical protein
MPNKSFFYFAVALLCLFVTACNNSTNNVQAENGRELVPEPDKALRKDYERKQEQKMKISLSIISEDEKNKYYSLDWDDTLGKKQGYSIHNRPKEIWCYITNRKKDTLDYYYGLSTSHTYLEFESQDSIVYLNFLIGVNPNYEVKSIEEQNALINYEKNPIIYESVEANLNQDLRNKVELVLLPK